GRARSDADLDFLSKVTAALLVALGAAALAAARLPHARAAAVLFACATPAWSIAAGGLWSHSGATPAFCAALPFPSRGMPPAGAVPVPPARRPVLEGVLGLLLSPSRGLLFFAPWLLLALLPWPRAREAEDRRWNRASFAAFLAILGVHVTVAKWWGGWTYGPR